MVALHVERVCGRAPTARVGASVRRARLEQEKREHGVLPFPAWRNERGPVAQALLTYGQSTDPASPRAFDQLRLFSEKKWLPLPFHRADVEAQREGAPLQLAY